MRKMILTDDIYEFDYEEVDGVHTLYFNNADCWQDSSKNTIAMEIVDDGNGLVLNYFCGQSPLVERTKNKLNYSESIYMTILLKLINSDYKFQIATKTDF